jgi:hypothetical protein
MTAPRGTTISFTKEEIDWLAWVVRDVLAEHQCVSPGESACDKIITAEELLQETAKVLNERT